MADPAEERRWRAQVGCDRRLSGVRVPTPRERLAAMASPSYDLDDKPDWYGGGLVRKLEERVAELLGKQDAAFFPSGTMAQQVALRIWAARAGNPAVAMHPLQHLEMWEREAYTVLTGLRPVWLTHEPRQPTPDEVSSADEAFGTLMVELPLREAGFLLPTFDQLSAMVSAARARNAFVHFDGARLWESVPFLGEDLPTIAALADSVYVSFYKTLQGFSGAALVGSAPFIAEARAWQHRYGGRLFQQWPAALAALAGLDQILPRLESYVAHARDIAAVLRELPGARVNPDPPHTHQFQLWLPHSASSLDEACVELAEREKAWFAWGWKDQPHTGHAMAELTVASTDLSVTEVGEIARAFLSLVRS